MSRVCGILLLVAVGIAALSVVPAAREGAGSAHLRSVLKGGGYLIVPSRLVVNVGEIRLFRILGKFKEDPSIRIVNPEVCDLVRDKAPFAIKGLRPGKTRIEVQSGSLVRGAEVTVVESAGLLPKELEVVVTGDRVSAEFLKTQLESVVAAKLSQKKGTKLELKFPSRLPAQIGPGQTVEIPVQAKISGKSFVTTKGTVRLNVQNQIMTLDAPSYLMVSNNPENFTGPATLFDEPIPNQSPVRFFYHHYNKSKVPYIFEVRLQNGGDARSRVHVMDGTAGPDRRELSVGGSAAERFFSALKHSLGKVVEIGAKGETSLVRRKVNPGECVSGILRLSPLDGSGLSVTARVRGSGQGEDAIPPAEASEHRSKGVFDSPEIIVESEYSVGGDYAFINLGKDFLLHDVQTAKPDIGNYGVFYTIHLALKNPTAFPATAHVTFSPQAGPAKGIFLINGTNLIKTAVIKPFDHHPLIEVQLAPGETRNVLIQTMPVGGSYYPVKLIAQP